MLTQLKKTGNEVNRALNYLTLFFEHKKVKCPGDVKKFIFLCGANKQSGGPSARRLELIDFSLKNLDNCHFFLAERVFKELTTDANSKFTDNLLDIESELSDLADHIVVVLESYSSFTELGAFSYSKKLRKKLIIINNTKYIKENSFINMGPIKAITDPPAGGHFLHYKMQESAEFIDKRADGIGAVFSPLHEILSKNERVQSRTLKKEELNPALNFNKDTIRFVHDIILSCGPLNTSELIEITSRLFGIDTHYKKKIQKHLGLLLSIKIIDCKNDLYYSIHNEYYFKYTFDIDYIASMFKTFFLKNEPNRMMINGSF